MPRDISVLFVCLHNSGRSQMAEAYLRRLGGDDFQVMSAGLEPQPLNPLVREAMLEEGFDLSRVRADSVFDFYREGRLFDYVIAVCDQAAAQRCPTFPGITKRLDWPFTDPALLEGSYLERLEGVRRIRDQIRERIKQWLKETAGESEEQ